ncbi:uncharacterized protein LOC143891309 [Tasmannia lanceolata]|uniref:uncharacterized protein LOC143891309 n=1 Tax=Tasmannia lanceolata TaxID=3420 RepID=UPI00406384F5
MERNVLKHFVAGYHLYLKEEELRHKDVVSRLLELGNEVHSLKARIDELENEVEVLEREKESLAGQLGAKDDLIEAFRLRLDEDDGASSEDDHQGDPLMMEPFLALLVKVSKCCLLVAFSGLLWLF